MRIITEVSVIQQRIRHEKKQGKTVGYVATMGYLHQGHATLMERARKENDIVVLSIFVNPLQFGPNEDFETYPRDMERDETVAKNAEVDYLFYPTVQEMYPDEMSINITVQHRTNVLCGLKRPGHFDGVATILTKFFNIIHPDKAYFGMKDAQQVAVIDSLVHDLNFDIEIVPVEIVREEDGLAKSSRNVYLLEQERSEAKEIYISLQKAKEAISHGEINPGTIISLIEEHINSQTNGEIDYVDIFQFPELKPLNKLTGTILIAVAVKFSNVRLIDNVTLTIED